MTQIPAGSRTALVTGASSGIGRAFALRLVRDGFNVIAVGRRRDRLSDLAGALPEGRLRPLAADLATPAGLEAVRTACAAEPIDLLINNAGVGHYGAFAELSPAQALEVVQVKAVAPTVLAQAVVGGMLERGGGSIVNVAGMLAFGSAAPLGPASGRAVYVAGLAHLVALTRALHEELGGRGLRLQALCPGIVATEFHSRQGLDLSFLPRMTPDEVVEASLRGLELGEVICAPGVEDPTLLDAAVRADLAAFAGQSPDLASRYRQTAG